MPLHPTVERLAGQVRAKVVKWTKNNSAIGRDLCGACGIASYALYEALRSQGRRPTLVVLLGDSGHCWVELSGYVVDLTATQFKGPRVAIFRNGDWPDWGRNDRAYLIDGDRYINNKAVEELDDWGDQSPNLYSRKIDRFIELL